MEYVQMTLNDWVEMKNQIRRELQGVKQSFVRIGYALRKIEDGKYYEQDGYKSVAEFAKAEYGLEATTVSRFMAINREFSIDGYSERIREEYLDLSRSQLEEMLKLPGPDREMITPQTPREDIRELKRFNREAPEGSEDLQGLIEGFFRNHPEELNQIFQELSKGRGGAGWVAEIVSPSGSRAYRAGIYFMMLQEEKVSIKRFGAQPSTMTYEEFLERTREIFEADAGPDTWGNHFGEPESEAESEPEEPAKIIPMNQPKPAETQSVKPIAPAQKSEEKPEQKPEKPEQEPEETEQEERQQDTTEAGAPAEEAQGQQDIVDKPFGSRKDYLDTLTPYGAAEYINRHWRNAPGFQDAITSVTKLMDWLLQEVDDQGRELEV